MRIKLIVFDLDGTLVNTLADLTHALNLTLRELGLPSLAREVVASHVGAGTRSLLVSLLKEHGIANPPAALKLFDDYYLAHLCHESHLYTGILSMLKQMKGVEKVILTNKSNVFLGPLLTALGIKQYFSGVYGLESFPTSKPDPGSLFEIAHLHGLSLPFSNISCLRFFQLHPVI